MVRIASLVISFIDKCRLRVNRKKGLDIKWTGPLLSDASLHFTAFPTSSLSQEGEIYKMAVTVQADNPQGTGAPLYNTLAADLHGEYKDKFSRVHAADNIEATPAIPSDKYLNMALLYYFRQASREVTMFNRPQVLEKRTVMKDGVLLSKGRILDGMNFLQTADLDTLNLGSLGVKTMIPVIDRFSPLAFSLAQHFHWSVSKHRGFETCLRMSFEHVHILQGMSLFREIAEECFKCKMKRGRYIQASQGPLSEKQLLIAPPFYACQVDLFGPLRAFVPGFEKETRAVKAKQSKIWIFVAVCLVTSNVNMQVCEMKDTCSMLEAFIRLSCECGYPKYVCCDQDSSLLPVMREVKVNLRDLSHRLYSEHGVVFETCAVGGHDTHGKVERTIKSVQEGLEGLGLYKMRLPAMGVQTLCKQVENAYNNLPLGYRYDRSQDNTEVLRMLVPNMLRTGRINSRALDGPVRLSNDNRKMLGEIQDKYEAWYKVWCEVYVPKLMTQKTGFKNSRDLQVGDLVYFQKKESELSSPWTMGKIDQIIRGRDGVIRRAIVKFRNTSEEFDRVTDRSTRKLIKLFSADDPDLQVDLSKLQARIDELQGHNLIPTNLLLFQANAPRLDLSDDDATTCKEKSQESRCQCCCLDHCRVSIHNLYGSKTYSHPLSSPTTFQLEGIFNVELHQSDCDDEDQENAEPDNLTAYIMSVGNVLTLSYME